MPFQEIFSFSATESFAADPLGELKKVKELYITVDGCLGVFAGLAEEEKTGWVLILWESYEDYRALESLPNYPEILGLNNGEQKVFRLELNNDPFQALLAPVTEVSMLTLKPDMTKAQLDAILIVDRAFISEPGCFGPISWAAILESTSTIFILLGWESSKKHYEVLGKPAQSSLVEEMLAVVDFNVVHVHFKRVL